MKKEYGVNIINIAFIGVALAVDASCVSTSNGLIYKPNLKKIYIMAFPFAFFQGIMPMIGYFGAELLLDKILEYNYFVVFIIFSFLGVKMIYEAVCHEDKDEDDKDKVSEKEISTGTTLLQVTTTSIDALVVGIMLSHQSVKFLITSSIIISVITFIMCALATWVGKKIGTVFNSKAEAIGGVLLIFLAVKVLIESYSQ